MLSAHTEGEENSESRARIHYEYWRIGNEREHALQALVAYQAAQTRAPKGAYLAQMAELKGVSFRAGHKQRRLFVGQLCGTTLCKGAGDERQRRCGSGKMSAS